MNETMPNLSKQEIAALKFMLEKPLRVDAFSSVPNREAVASMLDALARLELCQRSLEGLSRVYSITPKGEEALSKEMAENKQK